MIRILAGFWRDLLALRRRDFWAGHERPELFEPQNDWDLYDDLDNDYECPDPIQCCDGPHRCTACGGTGRRSEQRVF